MSSNNHEGKIWLDDQLYIEVDNEGRCTGVCNEGALGYVIQVLSKSNDGDKQQKWALKIPRLLSETHRENAYIVEVTEKELATVLYINGRIESSYLLSVRQIGPGYFRNPIASKDIKGAYMYACFEKGKKPLICNAKIEENKVNTNPENSSFPFSDGAQLKQVLSENNLIGMSDRLKRPIFLESPIKDKVVTTPSSTNGDVNGYNVYTMEKAYEGNTTGETWALGLPSVLFTWIDGTFQESVSRDIKGFWGYENNVKFIQRICEGIRELHGLDVLHADLRPANIVYAGAPEDPNRYYIADYGGYADTKPPEPESDSIGDISRGPAVIGERTSPFYAPERRIGIERETADTVFFIREPDSKESVVYVILAWRDDFRKNDDSGEVDIAKIRKLITQKGNVTSEDSGLLKGDRIQIRDYIFELAEDEKFIAGAQILTCRFPYWQMFHGRVAVAQYAKNYELAESLPIPRILELRQWSAASDIYSLGVLALYGAYYDSQRLRKNNNEKQTSTEQNPTNNELPSSTDMTVSNRGDIIEVEDRFRVMVDYMSNETTLQAVWPLLSWVRVNIEEHMENRSLNPDEYAEFLIGSFANSEEKVPLKEEAIRVVRHVALIVPGSKSLLEALNYNVGYFVVYIHFVLCCLHRRSDLRRLIKENIISEVYLSDDNDIDETERLLEPFSVDRREPANYNEGKGAAYWASSRLKQLSKYIDNSYLQALTIDEKLFDDIPEIGTADPLVRAELQKNTEWLSKYEEAHKLILNELKKVYPDKVGIANIAQWTANNIGASIPMGRINDIFEDNIETVRQEIENDKKERAQSNLNKQVLSG